MKKIVVTILFAGMMPAAFSQAPGNVLRGGLELWLKPSSFTAST